MNYYGDHRDLLEKLYPSCTYFSSYHSEYPEGLIEGISCGVVFLIAFWSAPAVARFKYCCYGLKDSVPWDRFELHIIDADGLKPEDPFSDLQRLGGYGEAFWIRSGTIVNSIGSEWSNERFDELTRRLIRLPDKSSIQTPD